MKLRKKINCQSTKKATRRWLEVIQEIALLPRLVRLSFSYIGANLTWQKEGYQKFENQSTG